ncbi:MerR family transcriptional regulator [Gordoniibacillus kamchatkensis]|uniref:MerR family transcriptional regulator n=1 Tax=Gordoniibacillus kamchatkensis TaxID=1590651 RepID=A0ABR5AKP0_9BACL|nr:MerR family transcriptional regulator [Paenibacillus sp. VKM B-2647]KIL41625.1 MerR family transcriptional regulator [Paenibacillus sp. VKM B-2647]
MSKYKIEEVAKQCGLTKRTLRYYEEIGLLFPAERSEGGYRLYTDKHIERLKQIMSARDVLGFSLQEIQEFISISEQFDHQRQIIRDIVDKQARLEKLSEVEETLLKQLSLIDQKLEKMNAIRRDIYQLFDQVVTAKQKLQTDRE